jgi:DNA-binding MarR family transcriptional regulator
MWLRIVRCYSLAMRELRASLRDECTVPQFDVLAQLKRSPDGLTFSELSKRLVVTAGNLTGIVDRLAEQGLVRRKPDPRDRRHVYIRLTAAGERYCAELIPRHERQIVELFRDLPENTVERLRGDLDSLASLLEKSRVQG